MNGFKRWIALSALALTMAVPTAAAADDTGPMAAKIDYSNADVMTKDGMELVALRQLAESFGYTVTWNNTERSVTLTYGMMTGSGDKGMTDKGMTDKSMAEAYTVKITIGSKTAAVAMKEQMLTYAPVILDNKTYVTKTFIDTYLAGHGMMMK